MLPEGSDASFQVAQHLRAAADPTPILFLTARADFGSCLRGLDLGGDDYLSKPFNFRELRSRLSALVRRSVGQPNNAVALPGGFQLPLLRRQGTDPAGASVPLTPREFELLEGLALHPERAYSREDLMARVWSGQPDADSRVVDVYVSHTAVLHSRSTSTFKAWPQARQTDHTGDQVTRERKSKVQRGGRPRSPSRRPDPRPSEQPCRALECAPFGPPDGGCPRPFSGRSSSQALTDVWAVDQPDRVAGAGTGPFVGAVNSQAKAIGARLQQGAQHRNAPSLRREQADLYEVKARAAQVMLDQGVLWPVRLDRGALLVVGETPVGLRGFHLPLDRFRSYVDQIDAEHSASPGRIQDAEAVLAQYDLTRALALLTRIIASKRMLDG